MLWCIHGGQKTRNCQFPLWVLRLGSEAFTCWDILNNLISHSLSHLRVCIMCFSITTSDCQMLVQRASHIWPHSLLAPLSSGYHEEKIGPPLPQLSQEPRPPDSHYGQVLRGRAQNSATVTMVSPQTPPHPDPGTVLRTTPPHYTQELFSPQP